MESAGSINVMNVLGPGVILGGGINIRRKSGERMRREGWVPATLLGLGRLHQV